jgi:hypothetical protein
MKTFLMILLCMFLTGCTVSKITTGQCLVQDPNGFAVYEGEAATIIAEGVSQNMQTAAGRLADTMRYNAYCYAALIGLLVAGLVFWGLTRSKWGWVIPASCIAGMGVLVAFARYAERIGIVVLLSVGTVALALLIWKAVEYQKERNNATKKEGV